MARLLIVDDDADQLAIRTLLFEHAGHQVSSAASPAESLAVYPAADPDIVVMDLHLPTVEDGLRLIAALRRRSQNLHIFVLSGMPEDIGRQPEAVFVEGFFTKPVAWPELIGKIEAAAAPAASSAAAASFSQ